MRFVLQRVKHASVKVDGELIGSIGRGYMVLMGVSDTDTEEITDKMVDKMCKLRIFEDENGKTNCSLADVDQPVYFVRGLQPRKPPGLYGCGKSRTGEPSLRTRAGALRRTGAEGRARYFRGRYEGRAFKRWTIYDSAG